MLQETVANRNERLTKAQRHMQEHIKIARKLLGDIEEHVRKYQTVEEHFEKRQETLRTYKKRVSKCRNNKGMCKKHIGQLQEHMI